MSKYYKIYHYGPKDIKIIDSSHYGTGATRGAECRRGKTGLDKIYFYTEDKPENCVASGSTRYEVYIPLNWKELVYDLYTDPKHFYRQAHQDIQAQQNRQAYEYEIKDYVEKLIYDNGFKGFTNTSPLNPLPHVVVFFYNLSTSKPSLPYTALDWSGHIVEEKKIPLSESGLTLFDRKTEQPLSEATHFVLST